MPQILKRRAEEIDISVTKGDSFSMSWVIKDKTTGVVVDVSTRTYAMEVRKASDNTLVATATIDMTAAASGVVGFAIAYTDIDAMDPDVFYVYDVEQTDGTNIQTICGGRFWVYQDVTA